MKPLNNLFSAMKNKCSGKCFIVLFLLISFVSISKVSLACSASFYPDSISGSTVQLLNTSQASNTAYWYWTFGDGTSSDLENPVHQYNAFGQYLICLTVYDTANNCIDTQCDSIYLFQINCNASFNYYPYGNTIYFNNTSQAYNSATWYWSFGDGTSSNLEYPSHQYTSYGTYEVCLTVDDTVNNCSDIFCDTILVSAGGCSALFNHSDSGSYVVFNNTSQSSNSAYWYWTFGDGTSSDLKNPTHQYNGLGQYNVCLTVYDTALNCTSTYCDSLYLNNVGCQASLGYYDYGLTFNFYNWSAGYYTNTFWDFGDGATSTQMYPSHTYSTNGTYTVCLTIYDSIFCLSTICEQVIADSGGVNGCTANFVLYPDSSQQGLYWGYNLSVGQNLSYSWSWGDGTSSTGPFPSHTYTDSGYYTICLSIYDTLNVCSDTFCSNYYILKQEKMMQMHEIIFVNATGIPPVNPIEEIQWQLLPNPASKTIRVETNGNVIDEIRITDMSGKEVERITAYKGEMISIEALPEGVFIIQSLIEGTWRSKLLIRQ